MENPKKIENGGKGKRSLGSSIVVAILGAISAVYLFNPTAGILELVPDNLPFVGNIDEAAAAALLISCLAYFGLDIGGLFGRKSKKDDGVIDVEVEDR
ncbi:MAG TPA: DUF1232 domain-containing protein [Verrucomicrobiales bacterium]|nr:DUF1232 domain-containing protein [Verrucomicrobiales bacterium]